MCCGNLHTMCLIPENSDNLAPTPEHTYIIVSPSNLRLLWCFSWGVFISIPNWWLSESTSWEWKRTVRKLFLKIFVPECSVRVQNPDPSQIRSALISAGSATDEAEELKKVSWYISCIPTTTSFQIDPRKKKILNICGWSILIDGTHLRLNWGQTWKPNTDNGRCIAMQSICDSYLPPAPLQVIDILERVCTYYWCSPGINPWVDHGDMSENTKRLYGIYVPG